MNAADLARTIATLAPTLNTSSLRVLLAILAGAPVTSRQLAQRTYLRRNRVQRALATLRDRGLVTFEPTPPGYPLIITGLTLPVQTSALDPAEPVQTSAQTGLFLRPLYSPVAIGTPPDAIGTPPVENFLSYLTHAPARVSESEEATRAPARVSEFDLTSYLDTQVSLIDRVLTVRPSKYRTADLSEIRRVLGNYLRQFDRRNPSRPQPDEQIAARVLEAANGSVSLVQDFVLHDLEKTRKEPGATDGWFVSVILNKLHGIPPQAVSDRREQLKRQRTPAAQPVQTSAQPATAAKVQTSAQARKQK